MKIFITGGTGFVGRHLAAAFLEKDHEVTAVGSSPKAMPELDRRVRYLVADTSKSGPWQEEVEAADIVINLAGRTIFHLWTKPYKKQIRDSRVLTTRHLVEALPSNSRVRLISAPAAGFYGNKADKILTEEESAGDDFLAEVCGNWESEALKATKKGAKVVIARFGVVIGKNGGAVSQMLWPYRFFIGGPIGAGNQWFPWIHISDLMAAVFHIIHNDHAKTVYNLTSPNPVQNSNLAKTIGQLLRRPSFLKVPSFFLRTFLGEFGSVLLFSQRAVPNRLISENFEFQYPEIENAILEVIR